MQPKDYFSNHSKIYAAFRPVYPKDLYDFVLSHVREKRNAWDCGTGNGQVAGYLADHFEHVFATDISRQQLDEAVQKSNISYSLSAAEKTTFDDGVFNLVTVGQALHWFNYQEFYNEVNRTSTPDGILAVWGYALLNVAGPVQEMFLQFYYDTVGSYWDYARKLVETNYESIPFPFGTIPSPSFSITVQWKREQFAGYLDSWSATQKFIKERGYNPVEEFMSAVKTVWPDGEVKTVSFPVFLKIGRIHR